MDSGQSPLADRNLHARFGSAAHRQVARECVRASLVLLKNEKRVLPASKKLNRIHRGQECGRHRKPTPYAEWMGDRQSLGLSEEDVAVVDQMKRAGMPLVVILISGRPIIIDKIVDKADALVAAWLPGPEGRGVTDVVFGDVRFVGKLSFSWPRSMDQIPINVGDKDYNPLFKYGFGLER